MKFIKSIAITLLSLLLITSCKSSPSGGLLKGEQDTGIYLAFDRQVDKSKMLHKTKYKYTDQDTYVIGFLSFPTWTNLTIYDSNTSTYYSYQDLMDDMNYSVMCIQNRNNAIEILTERKIGIEFNRNGDKKIHLHFINEPAWSFGENFLNERYSKITINESEKLYFDQIYNYSENSEEYKEYTWFIKNPYILGTEGILEYLAEYENIDYLHKSFVVCGQDTSISVKVYRNPISETVVLLTNLLHFDDFDFRVNTSSAVHVDIKYFPFINMYIVDATEIPED